MPCRRLQAVLQAGPRVPIPDCSFHFARLPPSKSPSRSPSRAGRILETGEECRQPWQLRAELPFRHVDVTAKLVPDVDPEQRSGVADQAFDVLDPELARERDTREDEVAQEYGVALHEKMDQGMGFLGDAVCGQFADHEVLKMALQAQLAFTEKLHREDQ